MDGLERKEVLGQLTLAQGIEAICTVSMTIMGSCSVSRSPQGSDLGRDRRFWVVVKAGEWLLHKSRIIERDGS